MEKKIVKEHPQMDKASMPSMTDAERRAIQNDVEKKQIQLDCMRRSTGRGRRDGK